ncbi:magnesium transporter MgtE N-terminal domain-containing protein [Selenomonas sputigena]|uniref:MotE family protein n=1 Tax=Selenomonas sputigena TaxID=69823 RepID=UPI0028E7AF60|nr:magnesium transporter MgtE [Selenomonas sputigena]
MKKIVKIALAAILLLVLVVGGFLLGVYLQIFDVGTMNEKMKLYDMPIIGEFFVKPAPETEEASKEEASGKPKEEMTDSKLNPDKDKDKDKDKGQSKPKVLTKEEIEKQMKEREAQEKKRVSKLARVYNEMKPQQAAEVMKDLDDDLSVAILQKMDESQAAKTLAAMDADQSARLTKLMYTGVPKKVISPLDRQGQNPQNAANEGQPTDEAAQ